MRFRRQMDDCIGPVALEDAGQCGTVAQIGLFELIARIAGQRSSSAAGLEA